MSNAYQRENRKVVALKFYFKSTKTPKKMIEETKIIEHQDLQNRLIKEFWLSSRQAQKTIKVYPIPYIKESLAIIKIKIAQKVVKNIPTYTVNVLKNDYSPTEHIKGEPLLWNTEKRVWRKQSDFFPVENAKSKTGPILLSASHSHSLRQTEKKAQKYFSTLSKQEQEELVKLFEDEKITSDILKTLYKKEWLNSTMFKVIFENYLTQKNISKCKISN